jgi:hypothetical protein
MTRVFQPPPAMPPPNILLSVPPFRDICSVLLSILCVSCCFPQLCSPCFVVACYVNIIDSWIFDRPSTPSLPSFLPEPLPHSSSMPPTPVSSSFFIFSLSFCLSYIYIILWCGLLRKITVFLPLCFLFHPLCSPCYYLRF